MSKVLVTYFSASGVTAKTANKLAKEVDMMYLKLSQRKIHISRFKLDG